MKDNYTLLTDIVKLSDDLIYLLKKQDFYNGIRLHRNIIKVVQKAFQIYSAGDIFFTDMENAVKNLLKAQESNDYILMSDIYEMQVKTACNRELERLHESGIWQDITDYYDINYNSADKELKNMLDMINAREDDIPQDYMLIENSVGQFSLKKKYGSKELIFSSSNNPYVDARSIIDSYANKGENAGVYIVMGLECGYIASVLYKQDDIEHIYVYEHDMYVIKAAMHYCDMTKLLQSGKISIIYDKQLIEFGKKLASVEPDKDDVAIIIQRPSMMNISDKILREKVEDFFLYQSSVLSQGKMLDGNFRKNTTSESMKNVHYLDELRDRFYKREVYFLAGGPSLEDKLELLKEETGKQIIVCVGTVLKLLLKNNIVPDYVVMIDSQKNMLSQIDGVNTENLSLIYIPTLFYGVVGDWNGKKYMAMQEGFKRTELMAKEKKLRLYETGGSVSTFALDFLIRFNCRRIVCMGLDLGFTDKRRHAGSQVNIDTNCELRKVQAVNGGYIYTSKNLDNYRKWIERSIDSMTDDEQSVEIINASNGAYIRGMRV